MIDKAKVNGRKNVKKHFWKNIVICFIITILLMGGYRYNTEKRILNNDNNISSIRVKNNLEIVEKVLENTNIKKKVEKVENYSPTRGVLSVFFNEITGTGSIVLGILNVNNEYLFNNSFSSLTLMIISLIIYFIYYIFFVNIIIVGEKRYFLEHSSYNEVSFDKLLFIYNLRKTKNVSKIMFQKAIYSMLWNFTIIGGIIKHYEYSMIPYILAENPDISSFECFELSKKMTNGHKMQMFLMDLSFIGWYLLGGLTLGLSNIFYFKPYKECIYAELYMSFREEKNYIKDEYLGESGELYPTSKYFIPMSEKRKWLDIDYKVDYSVKDLILLFFTFSFIGWIWEVALHLFNDGVFVNRGTMYGPILPIYGSGGILMLILLKKVRDNPFHLFVGSFILAGILEYFTAWYLEVTKGMKWWDYSGYFLNLDGRICLEGLLVFAFAGSMATYFVAPLFNNIYKKVKNNIKNIMIIVLLIFFIIDFTYSFNHPNSGKGISKMVEDYEISN